MDDLDILREAVKSWAASEPLVKKAYLFGSRWTKTNRPNSDLDVAVELNKPPGDIHTGATWTFEGSRLQESLQTYIAVPAHVQLCGSGEHSPDVDRWLIDGHELVYDDQGG